MRYKKLIPFTILTAMTIPVATIASGSIHASGTTQDELHEAVEDAYEDLRELASDGAPQDSIEAVKAEIDALMRNTLAEIASGERVNPDRFEDAVEDLVDALEDRFETSSHDSDDERNDDAADNDSDSDDDDGSDADEIAERYEDIEEAIAKAIRAIDAAETFVETDLIAEVRASLETLIDRANQADLTSRELKAIRDDIRAIANRFHDYLESDDDDSEGDDSDDHDSNDSDERHGFERVVEVMQIKAEKFDGDKKERFEARTEEFRIRYEAATDGESRRKVVEQERDHRIEEAKAQVANFITRVSSKLDGFANTDATDETLTEVRALQGALDRIATQVQAAQAREDLREVRDLINAEREEIGHLFIILEDLTDDSDNDIDDDAEEPTDVTSTTEVTS